jgi:hypothetical protein
VDVILGQFKDERDVGQVTGPSGGLMSRYEYAAILIGIFVGLAGSLIFFLAHYGPMQIG